MGLSYAAVCEPLLEQTRDVGDQILANGWAYEASNARTNIAYMKLGVGGPESDALATFEASANFGSAEAKAGPAFLALRRGDEGAALSLMTSWTTEQLADLQMSADDLVGAEGFAATVGAAFNRLIALARG